MTTEWAFGATMTGYDDITPSIVHEAILRNELFLEHMPTIALQEGRRCVGCEALVRWRRGQEIIFPTDFVPIVEDTPISGTLTYWVSALVRMRAS